MLASLILLCNQLEGPLRIEIEKYVEDFKIRELLAKIPLREKISKELEEYETIDTYNLEKIREIYINVIPLISSSGIIPPPSVNKYIDYFQDRSLQEAGNKQQEKIKKLEKTLEAEQKEIDELKGQI